MKLELRAPFPPQSWPRVWSWIQPFKSRVLDDFSPSTVDEYVRSMVFRTQAQMTFGVYRAGELGGLIWFERGNGVSGVIHVVFKRSFWGTATTEPMLREAVERYFATGAEKLNSIFFTDNHAVRAVVKKFGCRSEGVVAAATRRAGELVSLELWGVTKEEFLNGHRDSSTGVDHCGGRERSGGSTGEQVKENDLHDNPDLHAGTDAASDDAGIGTGEENAAAGLHPTEDSGNRERQ
jgi:RimJ/RimL family protein N-acetyltransferase